MLRFRSFAPIFRATKGPDKDIDNECVNESIRKLKKYIQEIHIARFFEDTAVTVSEKLDPIV